MSIFEKISYLLIWIAFATSVVASLQSFFDKKKNKDSYTKRDKFYPTLFIIFALIVATSTHLITCNENNEKATAAKKTQEKYKSDSLAQSNAINRLKDLRDRDSLRIKDDSFRFEVTLNKFGEQLNLQSRVVSDLKNVVEDQSVILGELTGGDSYVFVDFLPMRPPRENLYEPTNIILTLNLVLKGKYPLNNIDITIEEPFKKLDKSGEQWTNFYKVPYIRPPTNSIFNTAFQFGERRILANEKIIYFGVSIAIKNDELSQVTILKKIKSPESNYEYWVSATRVSSEKLKKYIYTGIHPDYPRDSTGLVDWNMANNYLEHSK